MSRPTVNLVLLLSGGALVLVAAGGTYLRYVTPAMRWPVLAAGVVVMLLAVADMVRDMRSAREHARGGDGAGHVHGPRWLPWLFAVPGLVLLFVGPMPITLGGAESALGGTHAAATAGRGGLGPLPDGPAPEIGMLELSRRAVSAPATLDGRDVTILATLARDGGGTRLGRVVITCCAADATTVTVRVAAPDARRFFAPIPDGAWVRAVVRVVPGTATRETGHVPEVTVRAATAVPAPANPYETPAR